MTPERYRELRTEMTRLVRRGRWSEAGVVGGELAAAARSGAGPPPATLPAGRSPRTPGSVEAREARRAELNGLRLGDSLTKVTGGRVYECVWAGPRRWEVVDLGVYPSISEAANAAGRDMRARGVTSGEGRISYNGWRFWGIERQEGDR